MRAMPLVDKNEQIGGSIIFVVILSIIILSALGGAISMMTSSSTQTNIVNNYQQQSYYAALSGINYAKSLTDTELQNIHSGASPSKYTLGDNSFTLTVSAKNADGTYPVASLGTAYAGKGNHYINSIDITPVSSGNTTNPNVPSANYAGAKVNFSGTLYTGDTIMTTATFNWPTIDGSIYYVNTGSDCLTIKGDRIGKLDGSSVICSNTCIIIDNANTIYGTIRAQGDITINRGIVYGDVYSGGNVKIAKWNGSIKQNPTTKAGGNLYLTGTVDNPANVSGSVVKLSSKPDKCDTYTLPNHEVKVPASDIYYASKTFTGTSIDNTSTYNYKNFSTNGGAVTCFDLSSPNTYVNIFVSGNLDFESSIYIKTSSSESCFTDANKITSSNYTNSKFTEAAKRIYIDVNGTSKFAGDGHAWVGTLFSKGDITTQGSFVSVGALYTNGSIDLSGGSYSYFVKSDYANTNW